jgi:hypothetical protein
MTSIVHTLPTAHYIRDIVWHGGTTFVGVVRNGTNTYIIRSEDYGDTWATITATNVALFDVSTAITRIASNRVGVLVGGIRYTTSPNETRIRRSTDNGATWTTVLALPSASNELYGQWVAGAGDVFVAVVTGIGTPYTAKIYRSSDAGATWSLVHTFSAAHDIYPTAIYLDDAGAAIVTLYASSAPDKALYSVSTDSGATWGAAAELSGGADWVEALMSDGAGNWIASSDTGEWYSANTGTSWTFSDTHTANGSNGTHFIATDAAGRWAMSMVNGATTTSALLYSTNTGATWAEPTGVLPNSVGDRPLVVYGSGVWLFGVEEDIYITDDVTSWEAQLAIYDDSSAITTTTKDNWALAIPDTSEATATTQINYSMLLADRLSIVAAAATEITYALELTSQNEILAEAVGAYALTLAETLEITDPQSIIEGVALLEQLLVATGTQTYLQAVAQLADHLRVVDATLEARTETLSLLLEIQDAVENRLTRYAQALDELHGALETSATLHLTVALLDTEHVTDATQTLASLFAEVSDDLTPYVMLRLGDEEYTGWAMNVEGDQPLSEYSNYPFNSMARIGNQYYGAGDEGLYTLDGDTDAGEPIDAALRTMMIDFGSPRQKRVRSAYLGYTASGTLLLRVRSVDDGTLKEQWYEAQELQAQAPRESMIRVGRGLRSRYWQFELVNVDGADFEIDKMELHPVYLNRRV